MNTGEFKLMIEQTELLGGVYRPITNTIGFLECRAETAAKAFFAWKDRTYSRDGRKLRMERRESASLEACLASLLPLTSRPSRWVFIETQSSWCAYIENRWRGTDPTPIAPLAGDRLNSRGIRCTNIPAGESPATILEVYRSTWSELGNTERSICAMKDGSSWTFDTFGDPFEFEQIHQYSANRIRDRFTSKMLAQYLNQFGISPFDESFYLTPNCVFYIVDIDGPPLPNIKEYSLNEAVT
ncbi:hypothetical protein C2E31_23015 [Rhodopirellula baltica]|nr:hypothetical protein C2E31_23015 [Rhodopirellula baltica]